MRSLVGHYQGSDRTRTTRSPCASLNHPGEQKFVAVPSIRAICPTCICTARRWCQPRHSQRFTLTSDALAIPTPCRIGARWVSRLAALPRCCHLLQVRPCSHRGCRLSLPEPGPSSDHWGAGDGVREKKQRQRLRCAHYGRAPSRQRDCRRLVGARGPAFVRFTCCLPV